MHFRCIKINGKVYLGMQQINKYNAAAFRIRKYRDFKFIQIFIYKSYKSLVMQVSSILCGLASVNISVDQIYQSAHV